MAASTLSTKRKLVDRAAKIEPLRVASAPFCSSHTEPQTEVDVAPSKRVLVIPGTGMCTLWSNSLCCSLHHVSLRSSLFASHFSGYLSDLFLDAGVSE
mmetsp:Transcript_13851/g.35349  ORF Transcript_13851/g.35349 Transcript_13851/m.35349 type:complete len:98 (-) Transcript_13851:1872-2165(-)